MQRYFFDLVRNRKSFLYSAVTVEAPDKKTARQIVKAYLDANRPGPEQYENWHLGEDAYGLRWHEEAFGFNDARISTVEPYDYDTHCADAAVQIVEGKPVEFDPDAQEDGVDDKPEDGDKTEEE
jgi:hypothetical protein